MISNLLFIFSFYYNKPNIIFFSGGSNIMPKFLYNNFLENQEKNYNIFKISLFSDYKKEINNIYNLNKDTILIGHSSGCISALINCPKYIKKIILLDPVKTLKYNSDYDLNFLEKLIIIDADLSYKWSSDPPFFPFIPFFSLSNKDLNIDKIKIKRRNIKNYGHTDILDNPWRDIMHYSKISRGNPNRSIITFKNYYKYVFNYIDL